ncbi:PASTA domain-containing protein [Streptomyces sp. B21-083]|uniref:PASTA domain-containing protein n=1 Tax=Streptomyces sp. B21-083 TaxID=3039410 RepID=UPI002FEF8C19
MTHRTDGTPFEEELVNAMNDFANSAAAPDFDSAGIVRKTRRRRNTTIAGIAAALIVAGGGTAIATGGSDAPRPMAVATSSTMSTYNPAATVLLEGSKFKYEFGGLSLDFATQQLAKMQLKLGTVKTTDCGKNGKPGTVVSVDPHEPKIVSKGATINLTLCAG